MAYALLFFTINMKTGISSTISRDLYFEMSLFCGSEIVYVFYYYRYYDRKEAIFRNAPSNCTQDFNVQM